MSDRLLAPFRVIVRFLVGNEIVGPRVDYLAAYPCVAVAQNGDGTLELQPDDPRIPPASSVPIRYGVPGVSATVAPGARVMLRFAAGDPSKPYAEVWESASVAVLTVTASAVRLGGPGATQALVLGTSYASHMAQLATALTTLSSNMIPALPPPNAAAAATAATAAATAATSLAADISAQNTTV